MAFESPFAVVSANGHSPKPAPSKAAVAERLVKEDSPTEGYRPQLPVHLFHTFGNSTPPLYLFYWDWLSQMHLHPRVQMAMETYKSGISEAKIKVKSKHPGIAQFAQEQFDRLWSVSLPTVQEGYDIGWGAFEPIYRFDDSNRLAFDRLKSFDPADVRLLTRGHKYYGIRIQNVGGKREPVDLWCADTHGLAKSFWYAHMAKHGRFFGFPQALGAWQPWRRLAYRDGAQDTVDMAVYRFGVQGPVVWYPPGKKPVTEEKRDPRDPGNRDLARAMAEQAKAGVSTSFPSMFDEKHGHKLWDMDWPEHVINVDSLINYNGSLEDLIDLGVGVPPEINDSGEGGGMGYRGREIPMEAYLSGQTKVARGIVHQFAEQVVLPLVRWEYGDKATFDVDVEPLMETRRKRDQGNDPNGNGVPGGKPPTPSTQPKKPDPDSGDNAQPYQQLGTIRDEETGQFQKAPSLGDPDMDAILLAILDALRPINREFVADLVWVLQTMPDDERWGKARQLLAQHRETIILALTEAGLGSALAAMRRVVEQLPASTPSMVIGPPVVPPLDIRSSGFDDKQPAYRLTMIDEAAANLAARQLFTKADFDDLQWQVKQMAFTVAGVPDVETIRSIRETIADAAAEGWSQQTWMKKVTESLGRDPFISPRHQETVFRTNIQDAYSKGLDKVLEHKYVGTYFPYEAIEPILDNRVRPHHAALKHSGINNTNIWRRDDPTFLIVKPPSSWNCRCGRRPLTVDVAAKAGVQEAQQWQASGSEPIEKAWVPLPAGWVDDGFRRLATAIPAQQSGNYFERWRNDLALIFAAAKIPTPSAITRLASGTADGSGHYHAPPGGITLRGKEFAGGEFIYADDFAAATPEQQQQIKTHTASVQGTGQGVMSVADELRRNYGPPKGKRYTNEAAEYFGAVGAEIHKRYGDEWQARVAEIKHNLEGLLGKPAVAADADLRNRILGKLSGLNWIMQHPPGQQAAQKPGASQTPAPTVTPPAAANKATAKPPAMPSTQGQDGPGVDTATVSTPPTPKPTVTPKPKQNDNSGERPLGTNAQRVQARKKGQDHEASQLIERIRGHHQTLRDLGEDPGIDPENDPAIIRARAADDQAHAARLEAAHKVDELTAKIEKLKAKRDKHTANAAALKAPAPTAPSPAAKVDPKTDPWLLTKSQFSEAFPGHGRKKEQLSHEDMIKAALSLGIKVPDNVLADYPHLKQTRLATADGAEQTIIEATARLRLSTLTDIREAAACVDSEPTDEQKKAGNYAKGHLTWKGLPITIETAKGQCRTGTSKDGKPWSCELQDHYGYIKRTESEADGDHIDVFLCEDAPESEIVYIVNQNKPDGTFDEHKVILGQNDKDAAKAAYLRNYKTNWGGFGSIVPMLLDDFKEWIVNGDTAKAV